MKELKSYNVGSYCRLSMQDRKEMEAGNRHRDEDIGKKGMHDPAGLAYHSGNNYFVFLTGVFFDSDNIPIIFVMPLAAVNSATGGTAL